MSNSELASLFEDLADLEEMGGNRWETLAYRKVAASIAMLSEDISDIYARGDLRKIEGVGEAIEKKIIEYLKTGSISKHKELKKKFDIDLRTLRNIQGLGPKRIRSLYESLGIRNLDDLQRAIDDNRIAALKGFGLKSQESLKKAVEIFRTTGGNRIPLAECYDALTGIAEKLRASGLFNVVEIAGSARRMKETVGDLDLLVVTDTPEKASDYFTHLDEVQSVIVRGETKISVVLRIGLNCDMRIIDRSSFGAALQYFTGSKQHNIAMRDRAISMGMKLNEYGLYRGDSVVSSLTEESIYGSLGLDWIPPELRENMGEIEAAQSHILPKLVEYGQVRGDLHSHTTYSDGHSSLEEMASKAVSMGLQYLGVTDHSQSLLVANGLTPERFRERNSLIDRLNERFDGFRLLKGVELEILKDGSLDLPADSLSEMDWVLGALHQWVSDSLEENTKRLVTAIGSGSLDAIAHPTGRILGRREFYRIDFDRVFQACADNGVALEINGFPTRSDLPYDLVKRAREYQVTFSLGSDSHQREHLKYLRFATAIARRGWLTESDIINTREFERVLSRR
ncbi:MAG TPA: DNA polymerase/3'-5' exonuclease PolX [Thermoplasmataceae archaeon]|nr:DNA polymerase/3'-5' exonuclease PolX [Thermoplasmataceae archaeon]